MDARKDCPDRSWNYSGFYSHKVNSLVGEPSMASLTPNQVVGYRLVASFCERGVQSRNFMHSSKFTFNSPGYWSLLIS